jgi:hypothetical protein
MGNSTANIQTRNWSGLVKIQNCTEPTCDVRIFLSSGGIILDSSVTAGNFIFVGVGNLTDNSTGGKIDSMSLVQGEIIDSTRHAVAALRPHHTDFGKTIYWDPISGDDTYNGKTPALATATFSAAHDLADNGGHDVIVALATGSGQTISTEVITISKNNIFLRGPGRDFKIKPTDDTQDTITINAVGIEISGMIVETAVTGTNNAIQITTGSDFFYITNVWSHYSTAAVIHIDGVVTYGRISKCFFSHSVDHTIHINGDVRHTRISDTEIDDAGADGIKIEGTTARNNVLDNVSIYASGAYAVNIVSPALRNIIHSNCSFYDNTLGNVLDNGVSTEYELLVGDVWEELTADHTTSGTTGKALSDAGSAGNPWSSPIAGNTDAGTFGELVGKKLLTIAKFLGLK